MNRQEKDLWRLVKPHLPGEVERIENLVGAGVPDVSGVDGHDYWIELKVCRTKKFKPPLEMCEPLQVQWHARRVAAGSVVFVMIRHGDNISLWWCDTPRTYRRVWEDSKPYNWGLMVEEITTAVRR